MCSGCVLNGGKQKLGSLSLREREREREREGEGEGGRDVCSGCVLNGGKQKLGDGEPTCEHSGVRVRVDILTSEFNVRRLYRTSPTPTYYVLDVWRIIGESC